MAGAGGSEVGRINIRVVPDLDQFRAQLLAELEALEKRGLKIKIQLANAAEFKAEVESAAEGVKARVDVDANTAGVREKIKAAAAGTTAKVKVEVDDDGGVDRWARRMQSRLQAAFASVEMSLEPTVDNEVLRRIYDKTEAKIRKTASIEIPLDVVEATNLRAETERLVKKAEDLARSKQAPFDLEKTLAERKKFESRVAQIRADAERLGSQQRAKRLADEATDFDKLVAQHKQFQQRVARIRMDAERLASADLLKNAEKLRQSRVDLQPQVLGTVFQNSGDADKLNRDMAEFNRVLKESTVSGQRLDRVLNRVSQRRTGKALKDIFNIGDADRQSNVLDKIGNKLAKLPTKLFNSIRGFRAFGLGLGTILAIASLLPAAISLFAGAMTTLPALLSAVVVPIAAIALGMEGIKKAAEVLQEPMDSLKATMSQAFQDGFTPVFEQLKGLFPTLEKSMPGVARGLTDVFQALVDTVTTLPGIGRVRNVIDNIGLGLKTSAPGIGSFATGIEGLASAVSNKLPGVGVSLSRIGDQFSGWVTKITTKDPATGVSQLDTALSTLKQTLAPLGGMIGDLFTKGFNKLLDPEFAKSMKTFAEDMRSLANVSFDGLAGAFETVAKNIRFIKDTWNKLPQGLRDFLGFGDTPVADPTKLPSRRIGMGVVPDPAQKPEKPKEFGAIDFIKQFGILGPIFTTLETYKNTAVAAADTVKQAFVTAWGSIAPTVATALSNTVIAIATFVLQMPTYLSSIPTMFSTAFGSVGTVVSTALQGAVAAVAAKTAEMASAVVNGVAQIPGKVAGAFAAFVAAVAGAMANAVIAVATGVANMVAEAGQIPGKIVSAVGDLGDTLVEAGKAVMRGLRNGIEDGLRSVLEFAAGIAAKIAAVKGPLPKDRTTLVPAGQALMQGLDDGMQGGLQTVLDNAAKMSQQISDAVNNGMDVTGMQDDIKKMLADLQIQNDALKVQRDTIPKEDKEARKAVTNQMDRISVERNKLNLTKDQNAAQLKLNKAEEDQAKPWMDAGKNAMSSALNVGQSVMDSFTQDLGISGSGALSVIGKSLIGSAASTASNFIFNTSNPDETMALFRSQQTQDSLQYTQR